MRRSNFAGLELRACVRSKADMTRGANVVIRSSPPAAKPLKSTFRRPTRSLRARPELTHDIPSSYIHLKERYAASSSTPWPCLHLASQDFVYVGLILLSTPSKPSEHICVYPQAHWLFDGPVKSSHQHLRCTRSPFRRIGKVDLRIRHIREPPQLAPLPIADASRKEHARGDSLF